MVHEIPQTTEEWNRCESGNEQEIALGNELRKKGIELYRAQDRSGLYLCGGKDGRMTHHKPITLREMMLFWNVDFHGATLPTEEQAEYENAKKLAKQLDLAIEASQSGYRLLFWRIYGGFHPFGPEKSLAEISAELERKVQLQKQAQETVNRTPGYALDQDEKNPGKYSLSIPSEDKLLCKDATIEEILEYLRSTPLRRIF